MNIQILTIVLAALGGGLASIRRDWQSYRDEKKIDPRATFEWGLSIASAVEGILIGLSTALAGTWAAQSL